MSKVIEITEEALDKKFQKQTDTILRTVADNQVIILETMGDYNRSLEKIRKQTDRNTRDIKDLQAARSFWIRCAIGFSGVATFLILLWKLISDKL
jgi:hypothetical protein